MKVLTVRALSASSGMDRSLEESFRALHPQLRAVLAGADPRPTLPTARLRALRPAGSALRRTRAGFGKWSLELLLDLSGSGPSGFQALRRRLNGITGRVLSAKLRELESRGFVRRTVLDERPPRVEYRLTDDGEMLADLAGAFLVYLEAHPRG